jgi:hypothetical protein
MASHQPPSPTHQTEPTPDPTGVGVAPWWRSGVLRSLLTLAVVGFGATLIAMRWDSYGEVITGADPAWVAVAVACLLAGNVVSAWLASELLAARGNEIGLTRVARIVLVPNVAKYIPGFIAQAATFYRMARSAGIGRRGVVLLWIETMWLTLTVTAALGGTALLVVDSDVPAWFAALVVAGSVVVLVPAVRDRLFGMVQLLPDDSERLGRPALEPLRIAGLRVVLLGAHGVALAHSVGADDLSFAESVAAFAGGWVVGLLVFVFPGGIGPREVVASVLLADFTSPAAAVALVVMSRFVTILADVIAGAAALLLPRSSRSSPATSARTVTPAAAEATGG